MKRNKMQHNEKSEVLSQEKDVLMEMHMKTGLQTLY